MIEVLQSMNCLFTLIEALLDSEDGFVSIAGFEFLNAIFNHTYNLSQFVLSDDVVNPFSKALRPNLRAKK